jgi:DGQHR domain-containing protein
MKATVNVPAFTLQDEPRIFLAAIPGRWLLKHSTPSWRIRNPQKGFQRVVKEERAREIALAVLDQGRTFPNTIVLATKLKAFALEDGHLTLTKGTRFLVVDGQHRLWAQKFATFEAMYGCVIHIGLSEVEMARLFLEINDNQRRVPSSLRWDLVRLVRPNDDPYGIEAAELVYDLATTDTSPLYQRIDLTGEQSEIDLKQGSIAPELKTIVSTRKGGLRSLDYKRHYEAIANFLGAVRQVDSSGWRSGKSPLTKARVLRALLRTLPDIAKKEKTAADEIPAAEFGKYLRQIDRESLSSDAIRALQGSAGIKAIYDVLLLQMGLA